MKPYVICHMMGPLDGQLLVDQWSPSTGRSSDELVAEYDRIHEELKCDAWISGRVVGEEFADGVAHPPAQTAHVERPLHIAKSGADEYAIFIDLHGKLHWTGAEAYDARIIMLLGRAVSDAHLAELSADGISYVVVNGDAIDLREALTTLSSSFGIKRLLLEGGAHTNAAFLKAGLVDEISLVLFPAIGGRSGAQTLFEAGAEGLADKVQLNLISTEMRRAGAVHLRYGVEYRHTDR